MVILAHVEVPGIDTEVHRVRLKIRGKSGSSSEEEAMSLREMYSC